MRVLIENGGYEFLNHGDTAMLQVAVRRLQRRWPHAKVQVLTSDPDRLTRFCPGTTPVLVFGRDLFFGSGTMIGRFHRLFPKIESLVRTTAPRFASTLIQARRRDIPADAADAVERYVEAVQGADLVIASGGGYLTDAFPYMTAGVMNTLSFAATLGKPTALLGQGIGPLQDAALRCQVGSALPQIRFISLREALVNLPLLTSLGYPPERMLVTGDDAIETAYAHRPEGMGCGIGISLRLTPYSGIGDDVVRIVREALHQTADARGARLVAAPISFHDDGEDARAIRRILEGVNATSDGGAGLGDPEAVMREVSHCRTVVTGSYHAAVFALSQGIPVVAVAKSAYYAAKFGGLAAQFGTGCEVVLLTEPDWGRTFNDAVAGAWESAPVVRDVLLRSAEQQIALSQEAHARLERLVS